MPRNGVYIFSDIESKLAMLRVECTRCGRGGRYQVAKLIEKYGRDAPLWQLVADVARDCPHVRPSQVDLTDRCKAVLPDLVTLFAR